MRYSPSYHSFRCAILAIDSCIYDAAILFICQTSCIFITIRCLHVMYILVCVCVCVCVCLNVICDVFVCVCVWYVGRCIWSSALPALTSPRPQWSPSRSGMKTTSTDGELWRGREEGREGRKEGRKETVCECVCVVVRKMQDISRKWNRYALEWMVAKMHV